MEALIPIIDRATDPENGLDERLIKTELSGEIAERPARLEWFRPAPDGLPSMTALLAFPTLLAVVLVAFVALGLTGSSTGFLHGSFETGPDERLIAGVPQPVRSDEWSVQTAWTISQVQQGLPVVNEGFPGGFDSTVQSDLPSIDWSTAFRPHLLGFLVLPLDNAMALKWWLPAFAMMAAAYVLLLMLVPGRPATAAFVSAAFFFSPFFQWWFLPVTFWPVTWALVVMSAVWWLLRRPTVRSAMVWGSLIAYLTVTTGTGVYVPFIVPVALVAAAFSIGAVVDRRQELGARFSSTFRRVLPVLLAGLVGGVVLVVWVITRWTTISRFTATVYPGQRSTPPGTGNLREFLALLAGPMTEGLGGTGGQPFASNQSEASTFFLVGLFLLVPLGWGALVRFRRTRSVDWLSVCVALVTLVMLAFMFVPGWDLFARLLLLDRTTSGRMRIGLGLVALVIIALLLRRFRAEAGRSRWPAAAAGGLAMLVSITAVAVYLSRTDAPLLVQNWEWMLVGGLLVACTVLFGLGRSALAGIALLLASVVGSVGVNPLYRGVYDLNQTREVMAMHDLEREDSGTWVGVGSSMLPNALLIQSGLQSYNGFQGAPSPEMWEDIDPGNRYEKFWNRLANVSWIDGDGEPRPENPAPDQIRMQFDSCAAFAQENVTHVVADASLDQPCLELRERFRSGIHLYEVTPGPAAG